MTDYTITVTKLLGIERMSNSAAGNPMWRLNTLDGTWRTEANSAVCHMLGGDEYQTLIGDYVVITLTKGRRVVGLIKSDTPF